MSRYSPSRDETSFPIGFYRSTSSSALSERMGAFGEMRISPDQRVRVQMPQTPTKPSSTLTTPTPILQSSSPIPQPSSSASYTQPLRVDMSSGSSMRPSTHNSRATNPSAPPIYQNLSSGSSRPKSPMRPIYHQQQPQQQRGQVPLQNIPAAGYSQSGHLYPPKHGHNVHLDTTRSEVVYMPTVSNSMADSTESRRRHDKLSDVYSMSGDTVEFARNLSDYINERIPWQLTMAVLFIFSLLAFLLIVFGTLNIPFCTLQPMIPIWLIVEGILFIISAIFRIYFIIPQPKRSASRRRQRQLGANLFCKGLELLFALANIVWLILGCVWVYGGQQYVHFEEGMFERHYCEPTVYWTAFIACTAFLIFYSIIIVVLICLLAVGSWKEASREEEARPQLLLS